MHFLSQKTNGTGSNGDEGVEVGSSTASSSRADGSGDSKQGTGMAVPGLNLWLGFHSSGHDVWGAGGDINKTCSFFFVFSFFPVCMLL